MTPIFSTPPTLSARAPFTPIPMFAPTETLWLPPTVTVCAASMPTWELFFTSCVSFAPTFTVFVPPTDTL